MNVDVDELKDAAAASLPLLTAQRKQLQASLIGKPLEARPPIEREIDELLVQEFLVKRIQRDIEASENPIGAIDPGAQERLDALADRLDDAIVTNARISAALNTATAFATAVKGIQGAVNPDQG